MITARLTLILCLFGLTGCSFLSAKAEYIPENNTLPNARVGEYYFYTVKIVGGRVFIGSEEIIGTVLPENSGVFLRNCPLDSWRISEEMINTKDHNCVEIYGTPTTSGEIKITIKGGMFGNMIAPASYFRKEYTLNVVEP